MASGRSARDRASALASARPACADQDTLIVSDLHLGLPAARPRDLLGVLEEWRFKRLILLGDVFHDWSFRHLCADTWRLLAHIRRLSQRREAEVVWVLGNHDRHLAHLVAKLMGIETTEPFRWSMAGARSWPCTATASTASSRATSGLGVLLACLRLRPALAVQHGEWPKRLDRVHVGFSSLSQQVEAGACGYASEQGVDVIVCGHTHRAKRTCSTWPAPAAAPSNTSTPAAGSTARRASSPSAPPASRSTTAPDQETHLANALVRDAALQAAPTTKRGILERVFARLFEGLVYAQIWEDPEVDLAALELGPTSRLVTIASGGCNVMSYLTADPMHVQAVDLNPAHVALLKLKLAAARHLPHYEASAPSSPRPTPPTICGSTSASSPRTSRPRCATSGTSRDLAGRRRIAMFSRNLYSHGLLGRTIQLGHVVCRLHGKRPQRMLDARDIAEQRRLFEDELAPVFDSRLVRKLADLPAAYFGLGIPPAQFDALKADAGGNLASLLRSPRRAARLRLPDPRELVRLAGLRPPLSRPGPGAAALPAAGELRELRERVERVEIEQITFTDFLAGRTRRPSTPTSCSTRRTG